MRVSIIICTRNRADSLGSTLESIGRSTVPKGWSVELLVIDNGSRDHTQQVVRNAGLVNVAVRSSIEPALGQCFARNRGLRESGGEIIVFTDDDVRVPRNWLEGICGPIAEGRAEGVAGGIIFPPDISRLLEKPPFSYRRSWFASSEELDGIKPGRMIGANMAFHRRVLERVPRFDVELGPGALGFGDDTLFSLQLLASGYRLAGRLDVAVEHHFDTSRLTATAMVDLARRMGRSHAYRFHHWHHQRSRLILIRLLIARLKVAQARRACFSQVNENGSVSKELLTAEQNLAFCQEYLRQRTRPPNYTRSTPIPR